jgi:peroxiredoxin
VHQLGQLKTLLTPREKRRVQILAVSPEGAENWAKLSEQLAAYPGAMDYPILQDVGHRVIDRYGILNPAGRGWPHPGTYIIDRKGIVRWKFVRTDFRERPSNEMIRDALRQIEAEAAPGRRNPG